MRKDHLLALVGMGLLGTPEHILVPYVDPHVGVPRQTHTPGPAVVLDPRERRRLRDLEVESLRALRAKASAEGEERLKEAAKKRARKAVRLEADLARAEAKRLKRSAP